MKNDAWVLTVIPTHIKPIGCKQVFKVKENSDGTLNTHKARLVDNGFHQQHEFYFHETFSPVAKPTTIIIILTLDITYKWKIH